MVIFQLRAEVDSNGDIFNLFVVFKGNEWVVVEVGGVGILSER